MNEMTTVVADQAKRFLPTLLAPIKTMLVPFIPKPLVNQYLQGKMTLATLKHNEVVFDNLLKSLSETLKKETGKIQDCDNPFDAIVLQNQVDAVDKYSRYIETIKQALKYTKSAPTQSEEPNQDTPETPPCWFDLFKDTAMRMNEPWRQDLLARCMALEEQEPGSMSLKTLWQIGLLETQIFHSFALFLDSSIDLDGYPVIILDRDDLILTVDSNDGSYQGNLIYLISGLIENGLIQYGEFELPSEQPILVSGQNCNGKITNLAQQNGRSTMIRLEGYNCSNLGLDLHRLYDPIHNHVSAANFEMLADMLAETEEISFENTAQ